MNAALYDKIADLITEHPDLADTIARATEHGLTRATEASALRQLATLRTAGTPDDDEHVQDEP